MSFKDEVKADIASVFLNADEFAEEHKVEGKVILCIVDTDRGSLSGDGAQFDLSQADFVLIAKTADLPPRKAAGALLNLDGKELTVGKWDEQDGVSTVELYMPETA